MNKEKMLYKALWMLYTDIEGLNQSIKDEGDWVKTYFTARIVRTVLDMLEYAGYKVSYQFESKGGVTELSCLSIEGITLIQGGKWTEKGTETLSEMMWG